ncbi:MAG TPA: hypothetical protein VNS55_04900 [Nocardioides sp.]|nr:hypothetical protein [Nocardioides sp.]
MHSLDPTEDFAITLVRRFLVLCEHPRTRERMLRVVERSSRADEEAPRLLRWLNRALMRPLMRRGDRPLTAMKWELVATQLCALATARYLVKVEPLASAPVADVVALAAPGVLGVLQGPDDTFAALVVDGEEEDLSDLGELDDLDELDELDDLDEPGEGGAPLRLRLRRRTGALPGHERSGRGPSRAGR